MQLRRSINLLRITTTSSAFRESTENERENIAREETLAARQFKRPSRYSVRATARLIAWTRIVTELSPCANKKEM